MEDGGGGGKGVEGLGPFIKKGDKHRYRAAFVRKLRLWKKL